MNTQKKQIVGKNVEEESKQRIEQVEKREDSKDVEVEIKENRLIEEDKYEEVSLDKNIVELENNPVKK